MDNQNFSYDGPSSSDEDITNDLAWATEEVTNDLSDNETSDDDFTEDHDPSENERVDEVISSIESRSECHAFDEVEDIRKWGLLYPRIPHQRLESLFEILRRRKFPELPKCAKIFLATTVIPYNIEKFDESNDSEFVYFGITSYLQRSINCNLHEMNFVELLVNKDGIPLYKSSSKEFWPILCKIYHPSDAYKPFPVAVYCGSHNSNSVQVFKKIHSRNKPTTKRWNNCG